LERRNPPTVHDVECALAAQRVQFEKRLHELKTAGRDRLEKTPEWHHYDGVVPNTNQSAAILENSSLTFPTPGSVLRAFTITVGEESTQEALALVNGSGGQQVNVREWIVGTVGTEALVFEELMLANLGDSTSLGIVEFVSNSPAVDYASKRAEIGRETVSSWQSKVAELSSALEKETLKRQSLERAIDGIRKRIAAEKVERDRVTNGSGQAKIGALGTELEKERLMRQSLEREVVDLQARIREAVADRDSAAAACAATEEQMGQLPQNVVHPEQPPQASGMEAAVGSLCEGIGGVIVCTVEGLGKWLGGNQKDKKG